MCLCVSVCMCVCVCMKGELPMEQAVIVISTGTES